MSSMLFSSQQFCQQRTRAFMQAHGCCSRSRVLGARHGYLDGLIVVGCLSLLCCKSQNIGFVHHRDCFADDRFPPIIISMSLAFSCLTFLTTIWGSGIVFTWLLNITGISALLVWTSIGLISLRFRHAYKKQGRSLSDLPYRQPLFPLLPTGVVVLGFLMFIAQGYAAVRQEPFEARVRNRF